MEVIEDGFQIDSDVLTEEECDALREDIAGSSERKGRAGVRNLMQNPSVDSIANDSRLLRIGARFLRTRPIPYRATLFEKSGYANWLVVWHQDTAIPLKNRFTSEEWGPWSTKAGVLYAHAPAWALNRVIALRIHLDDSTKLNGSLRVIPGSHKLGVLSEADVIQYAHNKDNIECICKKGDIVAMRPLLLHSSSKVIENAPRRVLHIEYANALELTDTVRIAIA